MSSFNHPRGSIWRKWDLHIHTPDSLVHHYKARGGVDVWEAFIADLENLSDEFKIIGINDYLFVDGYRKVKAYKKKGRLKNIDLILPVFEFKIEKFAGTKFKKVNLHVIFSEQLSADVIQSQFLNGLNKKFRLNPGLNAEYWRGLIDRDSLSDLGKKIKESVPPEKLKDYGSDLIEGFNNLVVAENKILSILDKSSYFNGKYLTAVGKTEWQSLPWNDSSIATKKDIINKVDFVFISSESTEAFKNAKQTLSENKVNDLLIDCSDAHYNSDSMEKDRIGNCLTWIKSDPTFEGLKQVIYEPEERLKIQMASPEEKKPYYVIDNVRFIDNSGRNEFPADPILLNPNLSCIIGGKSTGKSLLLYHIAKSVDPSVIHKVRQAGLSINYNFEFSENFDFEVSWSSGDKNALHEKENKRKIIYIPQGYLAKLSDDNFEDKQSLNEFILSLLKEDESTKNIFERAIDRVQGLQNKIATNLNNYFITENETKSIREKLKELGNKQGVHDYIGLLKGEINDIKMKSGLTPEENKEYDRLVEDGKQLREIQQKLERDRELIEEFQRKIEDECSGLKGLHDEYEQSLLHSKVSTYFKEEYSFVSELNETSKRAFRKLINSNNTDGKVDKIVEENQKAIRKIIVKIRPLLSKIKLREELEIKEKSLRSEEKKLNEISALESKLKAKTASLKTIESQIVSFYESILGEYDQLSKNLQIVDDDPDLTINMIIGFDEFKFTDILIDNLYLNHIKRSLYNYNEKRDINGFKYKFIRANHLDCIAKLIRTIITGSIQTLKQPTRQDALTKILKDFFFIDFKITYKNDPLHLMSAGKKNLALLKILIQLSKEQWPILIDQPEDALDNRSVFTELVSFLKNKKKERQVVIVTHNANVVVGSDTEEIVVANQKGQEKGADNLKYRFEYVSGSLEHDFKNPTAEGILFRMGIKSHVCEILEGGKTAFLKRQQKYDFKDDLATNS